MRSERPTPEPQGETVRSVSAEAVKATNRDKMKKRRSIEVKLGIEIEMQMSDGR